MKCIIRKILKGKIAESENLCPFISVKSSKTVIQKVLHAELYSLWVTMMSGL